jgi:mannose-6-phosphate isomerase-like protein (cupin superfamily)
LISKARSKRFEENSHWPYIEVNMQIRRRDLGVLLPALLLPGALKLDALAADPALLPSGAYPYDKLEVHSSNGGAQTRPVFKGKLATGESVELHETTLPPGGAPHPPHRHEHSEMWLVREGTVEFTVNDKSYRVGPGGVGFAASNDMHGVKNPGTVPCSYYVVAIGPGAAG